MTGDDELGDDGKDSTKSDEEEQFDYDKFLRDEDEYLEKLVEIKPVSKKYFKFFEFNKNLDTTRKWKKDFVKKSDFIKLAKFVGAKDASANKRKAENFYRLFDSYAVFVNQVDYSKNKKVFFDYVKEEISTEKIDREGVIKLISLIIQNLDWVDENGTVDEFEKSRGELEAAIPLAASINSTDLTYLILNLLAELCKYRGVDDSKYRKQSEIAIEKSSKEEDDDDEDWMWVLSPFANDDDTAAAAA